MVYNNLGNEISNFAPEVHAITICDTTSYKFNPERVHFFKKVYKNPSSLTLIKMLGLNINLTENLSKKQKICSNYNI